MQYKKHPIDRALEALVPILAPSFTLRSYRDGERLPKKYPLIDYAIVGSSSKEYDKIKNLWRTSYFVVLEILVQERKPLDWCQFSELADAQDRNALFLSLEVIVEQLLVLLINPKAATPLIRPLDMIYSDLDFKLEGNPTGQYLHEHGTDKLTGVAVNFTLSCLDNEGGACCLIDFNNEDQVKALQALTEPGSVTWNLLANQGGNPPITPCDKIKLQLTDVLLLNCILPLYDFANAATQNALSAQQILDLKTWLLPQYDFSDAFWQNLLTMQQEIDLTFYLLPDVDFSDPLIQAIITPQQQSDIINWLLPLVDFSSPSIQAIITPQQQADLSNWLCGAAFDYSFQFNGINQSIRGETGGVYNIEYNNAFSMMTWVNIPSFAAFTPLITKINNSTVGIFFALTATGRIRLLMINSILVPGRAIEVISVNPVALNTLQSIGVTYTGNGNASGVALYLNGVAQAVTTPYTTLSTTILNTAPIEIAASTQNGIYGNQSVNSARMWNIALTPIDAGIEGAGTGGYPNNTPVQSANLILDPDFDTSTFGVDTFTMNDLSGATIGHKSINMNFATRFIQP